MFPKSAWNLFASLNRSGCKKFSSAHSSSVLFYASAGESTATCKGVPVSNSLQPKFIVRSTSPSLFVFPFNRWASSTTTPDQGIDLSNSPSAMQISYVVTNTSNSPNFDRHSYFRMFSLDSRDPWNTTTCISVHRRISDSQ